MQTALTVKQLNLYVRSLIEGDARLNNVLIKGELSNFKNHYSSGHLYFTLKDKDASIRCVMFRSFASTLKFNPCDGMQVILRGSVSIYEKDGQYQFYAQQMLPDGIGDIALAFEQTKEKLAKEGLFDESSKRPLPKFPKRIAVVTSDTGAAVRDIMNILSRRWPIAERVMCPVAVQGESAVPDMISTLDRIYKLSEIDVIIIGRGGGSIEDLWAFNSEALARKIYESPIPVISAVGHETDFTICDFVADMRAPTPSAAAEIAVPDVSEIENRLVRYKSLLKSFLEGKYNYLNTRFSNAVNSPCFKNTQDYIVSQKWEMLDYITDNITRLQNLKLEQAENKLFALSGRLDALSPLKVLSRGYAAVRNEKGVVTTAKELKKGMNITVKFTDGTADCIVNDIKENSDE